MRAGQEEIENLHDHTGEKQVTMTTLLQNELSIGEAGCFVRQGLIYSICTNIFSKDSVRILF